MAMVRGEGVHGHVCTGMCACMGMCARACVHGHVCTGMCADS